MVDYQQLRQRFLPRSTRQRDHRNREISRQSKRDTRNSTRYYRAMSIPRLISYIAPLNSGTAGSTRAITTGCTTKASRGRIGRAWLEGSWMISVKIERSAISVWYSASTGGGGPPAPLSGHGSDASSVAGPRSNH